ncbi:major facilitator superfamily domain-containing protein 9-like [Clytia hemisphaerica]
MKPHESIIKLVCISGFLDLFGVAMVYPQLVHRAKELGASPRNIGLFGSIYGTLQFFSSPVMGQISDHLGRRNVLIVALLGTSLSYFLLGTVGSILFLSLARIPSGIFKFSSAMNKAFLVDINPPESRAGVLGKFNAASSIGFVIGPTIAGWMMQTSGGFQLVAYISGTIFIINALFNHFVVSKYLDTLIDVQQNNQRDNDKKPISLFAAFNVFRDAQNVPWHAVWEPFLNRFLMSFSLIIYRANFTSILAFKFGTDTLMNGYIQSFNGATSMATGWMLGIISNFFPSNTLMHNTFSIILVISLFILSVTPSLYIYVLCIIPLCVSSSVLRVTNGTAIANRAGEEARGLVMGLADTLTALARAFGPAIAGFALEVSYEAPGLCAATFALIGTLIGLYAKSEATRMLHVE